MLQEEGNHTPKKTFAKTERICSNKIIKTLILQNQTLFVYPFKCYYKLENTKTEPCVNQILISVSKKSFKKAVDRNLIKRRSKEAYRLHKLNGSQSGQNTQNHPFLILFVYIAKEILPYQSIEKSMIQILESISKKEATKQ